MTRRALIPEADIRELQDRVAAFGGTLIVRSDLAGDASFLVRDGSGSRVFHEMESLIVLLDAAEAAADGPSAR
jgi:hypothetical protein